MVDIFFYFLLSILVLLSLKITVSLTELAPVGDLYHLLHDPLISDTTLSWKLRVKIALDIATGMAYLHHLLPPVLHRDLRTPNIFVCAHFVGLASVMINNLFICVFCRL